MTRHRFSKHTGGHLNHVELHLVCVHGDAFYLYRQFTDWAWSPVPRQVRRRRAQEWQGCPQHWVCQLPLAHRLWSCEKRALGLEPPNGVGPAPITKRLSGLGQGPYFCWNSPTDLRLDRGYTGHTKQWLEKALRARIFAYFVYHSFTLLFAIAQRFTYLLSEWAISYQEL